MTRGSIFSRLCGAIFIVAAAPACAVLPAKNATGVSAPIVQRDVLAEAARNVSNAPWPKPRTVSLIARLTGGGAQDALSRNDAIRAYVAALEADGLSPQLQLQADASANLAAADRLNLIAQAALDAPRLTVNDIALVEGAIGHLREHRDMYLASVDKLNRADEGDAIREMLREDYRSAIRRLGDTANQLAERIERDRRATFAGPDEQNRSPFSDL